MASVLNKQAKSFFPSVKISAGTWSCMPVMNYITEAGHKDI